MSLWLNEKDNKCPNLTSKVLDKSVENLQIKEVEEIISEEVENCHSILDETELKTIKDENEVLEFACEREVSLESSDNENIEMTIYEANNELSDSREDFKDPGCWEKLTDSFRTLIVEKGPDHIDANYYFPLNDEGRHFDKKWLFRNIKNGEKVRRQWLIYSCSKDAIYCFPCLLFGSKNKIRGSPFLAGGFSDWKHLNPRTSEHENSTFHANCVIDWKELERRLKDGKTIDNELQKAIQKEKNKWRHILTIVTRIILVCAKNNLALRGSSEKMYDKNCGIFLSLIELVSYYDSELLNHIKNISDTNNSSYKYSYFSPTIQNELIEILGKKVKTEALNRIKNAKYFSILFDCTPDVSHEEQLTEIIRYVHIVGKEVTIEETVIDFISTTEKTGKGLANEITTKLFEDGLDIKNCRGQGFDNGSNKAEIYNGVQAHILQKNSLAIFAPCVAHSLNLVGVNAAETSTTFFRNNSKNVLIFFWIYV